MKKNIYKIFQFSIISICLYLIITIISEEKKFIEIFFDLNIYEFLPSIFLSIIISLLYSLLIFDVLLSTTKIKISLRRWLFIFFNSQFLDTIPFAGFFYKAVRLKKFNLNFSQFLFSYLFIFASWIALYSFFFFIDISILSLIYQQKVYFYYALLFLCVLFLVLLSISLINKLLKKINFKKYFLIQVKELIYFINLNFSKKNTVILTKYGFLIHIFEFILYLVIVKFLGLNIDLKSIFIIFLVNSIIDFFPITPKNIGFSEFISGLLLDLIGFNFTTGVLIKVFVRISSLLSTTILFFFNNLFNAKQ